MLLIARSGAADTPQKFSLHSYRRTAGCPSEATLVDRIRARASELELAADTREWPSLTIELEEQPGHAIGRVEILYHDGSRSARQIQGSDCNEVATGLALIAVLALKPHAPEPLASTEPPSDHASSAANDASPKQPPHSVANIDRTSPSPIANVDQPSRSSMRLAASGAVEVMEAVAPVMLFGGNIGLEVQFSRTSVWTWGTRLSGSYAPPRTSALAIGSGSFWFQAVRAEECPLTLPMTPRLSLLPCANFEAGRLVGRGVRGRSISASSEYAARWYAPGISGRLRISWPDGWDTEVLGGVSFPLARDSFLVREGSTIDRVHVPGPACARIAISLGRHFP
jgi:hypothetical protein